jgi:hypothetical protein
MDRLKNKRGLLMGGASGIGLPVRLQIIVFFASDEAAYTVRSELVIDGE